MALTSNVDAVVGLGANLGDRFASLRAAVRELRVVADVVATSRVYETRPIGGPPQGDYLNAAALVAWPRARSPRELMDALLAIEKKLGRERSAETRWGPRVIDLDLLWIEGVIIHDCGLEVPHPRLHERAFALLPLLDVAPRAIDPRTRAAFTLPSSGAGAGGDDGVRATDLAIE